MGSPMVVQVFANLVSLPALLHLGRHTEARLLTGELVECRDQGQLMLNALVALSEAHAGRHAEAQSLLSAFLAQGALPDRPVFILKVFLHRAGATLRPAR